MVLTERDKKLLYLLAVLVIVVGFGALVILPQWEKHTELADQLETVQQTQQEMETAIANLDVLTLANETAQRNFANVTKDFYEVMESHAAERMITRIVLSHKLSTSTFDINATPEPAELTPYIASELGLNMGITEEEAAVTAGETNMAAGNDASTTSEESAGGENADGEEPAVNNLFVDHITLTASGSTANMKALVDDLMNNYPSILVTSYSMASNSGITSTNEVLEVSQVSIGLNLYMVYK